MSHPAKNTFSLIVGEAAQGSDNPPSYLEERPDDGTCVRCDGPVAPLQHPCGDGWMHPPEVCNGCDWEAWREDWQAQDRARRFDRAVTAAGIPDREISEAGREDIPLHKTLEAMARVAPGERRDISAAYLYGDVGTGKSVQCGKALLHYLDTWVRRGGVTGVQVRYCNPTRLIQRYKASFDGGPVPDIETLITCDFLVLDDIGVEKGAPGEKGSDWARGEIYNIVNGRYEERKLTLFTSNYALTEEQAKAWEIATGRPGEQLEEHYNYTRRTVSRIFQMCGGSAGRLTSIHLTTNWRKPGGKR